MNKIGLQLYSVRDHLTTEESAGETFKKLAELGYTEVQTAGCYGMDYGVFGKLAKDAGIEIVGTHDSFDDMCEDIETCIENHKKLGTTNMGIGGFGWGVTEAAVVQEFIDKVNKIARRLKEEGMKFTYHNHSQEFIKLDNGKSMMEMFMEGFEDNVSFVLDTYWVQNAGGDVCTWIEKLNGRIDILHLKDMAVKYDEKGEVISYITEVGNGNIDFKKAIETAEKCGVKYFCVEQDNCPFDFEPSLKMSSDYLHKLCNF